MEMHLDNHKSVHRAIEEFQTSLKDARLSEVRVLFSFFTLALMVWHDFVFIYPNICFFFQIQMSMPLKLTYSEKLNKLGKQYEQLLVSTSLELSSFLISFYFKVGV